MHEEVGLKQGRVLPAPRGRAAAPVRPPRARPQPARSGRVAPPASSPLTVDRGFCWSPFTFMRMCSHHLAYATPTSSALVGGASAQFDVSMPQLGRATPAKPRAPSNPRPNQLSGEQSNSGRLQRIPWQHAGLWGRAGLGAAARRVQHRAGSPAAACRICTRGRCVLGHMAGRAALAEKIKRNRAIQA